MLSFIERSRDMYRRPSSSIYIFTIINVIPTIIIMVIIMMIMIIIINIIIIIIIIIIKMPP